MIPVRAPRLDLAVSEIAAAAECFAEDGAAHQREGDRRQKIQAAAGAAGRLIAALGKVDGELLSLRLGAGRRQLTEALEALVAWPDAHAIERERARDGKPDRRGRTREDLQAERLPRGEGARARETEVQPDFAASGPDGLSEAAARGRGEYRVPRRRGTADGGCRGKAPAGEVAESATTGGTAAGPKTYSVEQGRVIGGRLHPRPRRCWPRESAGHDATGWAVQRHQRVPLHRGCRQAHQHDPEGNPSVRRNLVAVNGFWNYDHVCIGIQKIVEGNGPSANALAVVLSPRDYGYADRLKDGDSLPLAGPVSWQAMPKFVTNQIPTNLGTDSNESESLVGAFNELLVGMRTELQTEASRVAAASSSSAPAMCRYGCGRPCARMSTSPGRRSSVCP